MKNDTKPKNVDEYISSFDQPVKRRLIEMRTIIRKAAPGARETISYGMPAYKKNKSLVFFAGYQKHIGFYPTPSAISAFEKEIRTYPTAKGSVQFPPDKPLPADLIKRMVAFRVKEDAALENAGKPNKIKKENDRATEDAASLAVKSWLEKQEAGTRSAINAVRKIIKQAAPELSERIKWNAPSYYFNSDIVTFGPSKEGMTLLVFHHPAITRIKSPLLEGNYRNRRLVYFKGIPGIRKNKAELIRILKEHMKLIS